MRVLLIFSAVLLTDCQRPGLQSQDHYREALENMSMSSSLVRIAVGGRVDTHTTCVFANRLLLAIAVERDPKTRSVMKKDFDVALAQKDHRFSFARPEAIKELGLRSNVAARSKACAIIERGKQAMRADYTGEIVEGVWKGG